MNHKRTIRKQKKRYTRYKRHRNLFGVRKGKTRRYKRSQPKRGGDNNSVVPPTPMVVPPGYERIGDQASLLQMIGVPQAIRDIKLLSHHRNRV